MLRGFCFFVLVGVRDKLKESVVSGIYRMAWSQKLFMELETMLTCWNLHVRIPFY